MHIVFVHYLEVKVCIALAVCAVNKSPSFNIIFYFCNVVLY